MYYVLYKQYNHLKLNIHSILQMTNKPCSLCNVTKTLDNFRHGRNEGKLCETEKKKKQRTKEKQTKKSSS